MKPAFLTLFLVILPSPEFAFPLSPSSSSVINGRTILSRQKKIIGSAGTATVPGNSFIGQQYYQNRPRLSTSCTTSVLQSSLLSTVITTIDTFWRTSPYAAAALTCGFKASAADYVAQKRQVRKEHEAKLAKEQEEEGTRNGSITSINNSIQVVPTPTSSSSSGAVTAAAAMTTAQIAIQKAPKVKTDKLRNLAYLMYGAMYQGMAQEFIYNHIYPALFGVGTDPMTVVSKVLFDLLIQTTCLTLPIAYLTKAITFRYSFKEAFRRYRDDILNHGLLTKYFMLWGPVQCLTFSIVPEHFRVTFIAGVSFFWIIILSSIASKKRPVRKSKK